MSYNRKMFLRRRPEGLFQHGDFDLVEAPMPEVGDGEALIKVEYLGIDATVRTWLNRGEGYMPAVEIGEVVRCSGGGPIIESKCDTFVVGQKLMALPGLQETAVHKGDV